MCVNESVWELASYMGEFNISVGCVTFHSWLSLTESPPPPGSGSYWMILLITLHFSFFILGELWEMSHCHHHPTQTLNHKPKTTVGLIHWINYVPAKCSNKKKKKKTLHGSINRNFRSYHLLSDASCFHSGLILTTAAMCETMSKVMPTVCMWTRWV